MVMGKTGAGGNARGAELRFAAAPGGERAHALMRAYRVNELRFDEQQGALRRCIVQNFVIGAQYR